MTKASKPKGVKEGKPGVFNVAINALADFRIGLADDGPQKGWTAEINKAIAVLEAAGEVHPWEDMDRTCDMSAPDTRRIARAIYEAHRDR